MVRTAAGCPLAAATYLDFFRGTGMAGATTSETGTEAPVRVLVAGAETSGALAIVEMRLQRQSSVPRHVHANEDEIVYVLEGHLTVNLDGATIEVPAGSCLTLPRNVEHWYQVGSDQARLLVNVTPAGFEGYYRDIGMLESPEVEHLVTTAARYGVTITGPAV
jgi:quercetin dioxygenase-like cupin family protein